MSYRYIDTLNQYILQVWSLAEIFQYSGPLDTSKILRARLSARAANTVKTYRAGFNMWKNFAVEHKLKYFPVNQVEFEIFLTEKVEQGVAFQSLKNVIHAVNHFHNLFYLKPIQVDSKVLDFCQRFCRKVDNRKRPLFKSEFNTIVRLNTHRFTDFKMLRDISIVIFAFIGFLRFDDLSQLRLCDVDIFGSSVKLKVFEAKSDKHYAGQKVEFKLSARCYDIVKSYVKLAKFSKIGWHKNDVFFFMPFKNKEPCFYEKLSYKECRLCILKLCKAAGISTDSIGTHSLRIGGCSEVSRLGVPSYLIDIHGRWAPGSRARAGYQRITPQEQFLISDVLK